MGKIDTSCWGEFLISDVFITNKKGKSLQVPTGANVSKKDLEDGETPRITVTGINNGVSGYYSDMPNDDNYRVHENFISVSFLGTIFYQKMKASLDMKVHCLKPKNHELNDYTSKFLVTALLASLKESSYADQISSTVLPALIIKLPIDSEGNPDWAYMEEYMRNIEVSVSDSLSKLTSAKDVEKSKIDISGWGEFNLYDDRLFAIDSGNKFDRSKMTMSNPTVNFVGRTAQNNGINAVVDKLKDVKPYSAGCITVALGGSVGASFVQSEPFYTSQNVIVLKPNLNLTEGAKWFICTAIQKESDLHYQAFVKELNSHIKRDFVITLPVDEKGNPDWAYMESYMKSLELKVKGFLDKVI